MIHEETELSVDTNRLLDIVRIQSEIARAQMDLGSVMDMICEKAQAVTSAGGAVVELHEENDMVYRAASGQAQAQLGLRIPMEGSLSGLCIRQGQVLVCLDSETDPRVNRDACRKVGLRSMIVVPLVYNEHTVGVLKVVSPEPNTFGDKDRDTLSLLSQVIASAMAHATQYEAKVEESRSLYYHASHDSLTNLGNRSWFFDRFRQALALAQRTKSKLGVALLDMDGLKRLNDTHGHAYGDTALRTLADRLRVMTRDSDSVARLGGDEFGIILSNVGTREDLEKFVPALVSKIEGSFEHNDKEFDLRASIGTALFPDDGVEAHSLIEHADARMYLYKRQRNGGRDANG